MDIKQFLEFLGVAKEGEFVVKPSVYLNSDGKPLWRDEAKLEVLNKIKGFDRISHLGDYKEDAQNKTAMFESED